MIIWSVCDSSFGVFAAFAGFRARGLSFKNRSQLELPFAEAAFAASAESFEPIFAEGAVQWVRNS